MGIPYHENKNYSLIPKYLFSWFQFLWLCGVLSQREDDLRSCRTTQNNMGEVKKERFSYFSSHICRRVLNTKMSSVGIF